MQTEKWVPIAGFENLYEVSNLGRIKSLRRFVYEKSGKKRVKPEKILSPIKAGNYLGIQLISNKKSKKFYIHRLVAAAFLEKEVDKNEVNHKNGDRYDNRKLNLEWVNHSENERHAYRTGLINPPRSKLTHSQVNIIRNDLLGTVTQRRIAKMFNVSPMAISRIKNHQAYVSESVVDIK